MSERAYAYLEPPAGWVSLLKRWPVFASNSERAPIGIGLSGAEHSELAEVHREVAQECPYKHDFALHSMLDYWQPATEAGGDCEDQALARWLRLLKRGWRPETFALCLCESAMGYHAVLLVFTDSGFVVLDNLMWLPAALPSLTADIGGLSGYRWHSRSDPCRREWVDMRRGLGLAETEVRHPRIGQMNIAWNKSLGKVA